MSARIKSTLLAVTAIALGVATFIRTAQSDQNQLVFSIPEPPIDQQAEKWPDCIPSRNVGIAESAKDYYSSCHQTENAD